MDALSRITHDPRVMGAITDVNERCQEPVGVCVRALQLGEEPTAAYSINVASG
jgi:hypothetical protein